MGCAVSTAKRESVDKEDADNLKLQTIRRKTFQPIDGHRLDSFKGLPDSFKGTPSRRFRDSWTCSNTLSSSDSRAYLLDAGDDNTMCVHLCCHTQPGLRNKRFKTNQDRCIAISPFGGRSDALFLGLWDGHGPSGEKVSELLQACLPLKVGALLERGADPEQALREGHLQTDAELKRACKDNELDDADIFNCGTTSVVAIIIGRSIWIANVGDSRCVLCRKKTSSDDLTAEQPIADHCPKNHNERVRIEACGGVVAPYNNVGYDRVWLADCVNIRPGLAVTRSFGDLCAETVGVHAEPEVIRLSLVEDALVEMVILMSDGVFEHADNAEVVNTISDFDNPADASVSLVTSSFGRWIRNCGDSSDDITIIAAFIAPLAELTQKEKDAHKALCKESAQRATSCKPDPDKYPVP